MEGGGGFVDGMAGGRRASIAGQHRAEAAGSGRPLHAEHCCGRGESQVNAASFLPILETFRVSPV